MLSICLLFTDVGIGVRRAHGMPRFDRRPQVGDLSAILCMLKNAAKELAVGFYRARRGTTDRSRHFPLFIKGQLEKMNDEGMAFS